MGKVDVDDAFAAVVELRQRRAWHARGDPLRRRAARTSNVLEINGEKGSVCASTWSA
jgi:hypothetical protein